MIKPKVLYAFCGTGQGHMAKADALREELNKRYDVKYLASSLCNPLLLDVDYQLKGATLVFGDDARLDIPKTFWAIDAKNYVKESVEIDLSEYDFVINDHETVTTTAAYISGYKNIFTFLITISKLIFIIFY